GPPFGSSPRLESGSKVGIHFSGASNRNSGFQWRQVGGPRPHARRACKTVPMTTGTSFATIYSHRSARVPACTVPVALADPATNADRILAAARQCHQDSVAVAVFPELSLTGYSIDDLHLQDPVSSAVETALSTLSAATADLLPVLVVGAPLR